MNSTVHRVTEFALVALLCFGLSGCASSGSGNGIIQPMTDTMGGLFLELRVDKPSGSTALYSITKDGVISFAGGAEARNGDTEWTDALTDDERAKVIAHVEEFGWLERKPGDSTANAEHVYRLKVRQDSRRTSYVVHGDNVGLVKLSDFLDAVCRRRFDAFVDTLPQPGAPRR